MSSVVIFRVKNADRDFVVALADTGHLVRYGETGVLIPALETASRLFSIPLRVFRGFGYTGRQEAACHINTSYGLSFSGNDSIGQKVAGALSQTTPFLECIERDCKVTLRDVADHAAQLLSEELKFSDRNDDLKQLCEFAVFGVCPADEKLHAYHLRPRRCTSNGYSVICQSFSFEDPLNVIMSSGFDTTERPPWLILGNFRNELQSLIDGRLKDIVGLGAWSSETSKEMQFAPQFALEAAVCERAFPALGHRLQVLVADRRGARPCRWQHPKKSIDDFATDDRETYAYLGYGVESLGSLSNSFIGASGALPAAYKLRGDSGTSVFFERLNRVMNEYRVSSTALSN